MFCSRNGLFQTEKLKELNITIAAIIKSKRIKICYKKLVQLIDAVLKLFKVSPMTNNQLSGDSPTPEMLHLYCPSSDLETLWMIISPVELLLIRRPSL